MTLLFNRSSKDILSRFVRPAIGCDNDDCNHSALINRQLQTSKKMLILTKPISFLPTQTTAAMQQEDREPHMHRTVVGHGSDDHKGRSYNIRMTKTGCIITRMKRYIKANPISVDDYPRKKMSKNQLTATRK